MQSARSCDHTELTGVRILTVLGFIPSQRAGVSVIVAPRSTRRMQTAHSSLLL